MAEAAIKQSDVDNKDLRLDRESLVHATIENMRSETRKGYQSQVDKLDDDTLFNIGLLKAQGNKHDVIHAQLVKMIGGDEDGCPNYIAVNRWLNRFGFVYGLQRAKCRSRLADEIDKANLTGDLQTAALMTNQILVQRIMDTLLDNPDLSDLSNGQQSNLIYGLSTITKAGFDEKLLAARLQESELKSQKLQQQIDLLNTKLEAQRAAAETAKQQIEQEATKSKDGRVDAQTLLNTLRDNLLGGVGGGGAN